MVGDVGQHWRISGDTTEPTYASAGALYLFCRVLFLGSIEDGTCQDHEAMDALLKGEGKADIEAAIEKGTAEQTRSMETEKQNEAAEEWLRDEETGKKHDVPKVQMGDVAASMIVQDNAENEEMNNLDENVDAAMQEKVIDFMQHEQGLKEKEAQDAADAAAAEEDREDAKNRKNRARVRTQDQEELGKNANVEESVNYSSRYYRYNG